MNILIIGKFYSESFAEIISENLEEMGHTVIKYRIEPRYKYTTNILLTRWIQLKRNFHLLSRNIPSILKKDFNKLFRILNHKKIDLTILNHDYLIPELVDRIKQATKTPIILWHPDHFSASRKFMFLNCNFDYMFFEDPYMVHIFRKELNKKTSFYLPECFSPKYMSKPEFNDLDKLKYGCDISTVGSPHSSRMSVLKQIKDYNVKIWGVRPPLWMDVSEIKKMITNQTVLGVEKAKAFNAAKIVLNTVFPANIWGVNGRAFEVAGCGAFQLISWRLGLKDTFIEDKEIIGFRGVNDMIEKIDYYLAHDEERNTIAEAGYKRALRDHTYKNRLNLLIDSVFNNKGGYIMPEIDYNIF